MAKGTGAKKMPMKMAAKKTMPKKAMAKGKMRGMKATKKDGSMGGSAAC